MHRQRSVPYPRIRRLGRDLARYACGGLGAVTADYLLFTVLVHGVGGIHPAPAQAAGRALGGIVSFLVHRYWTFRETSGEVFARPLARFLAVWAVMYVLSIAAVALAVTLLQHMPVRAKLMADTATALLTFLLQRHWTFRPPRDRTLPACHKR